MAGEPIINFFQIKDGTGAIYADTGFTLEWDVSGAEDVTIDGLSQPRNARELSFKSYEPGSHTFTLKATNSHGSNEATVEVKVLPPVVMALRASTTVAAPGDSALLVWEARGAGGPCRLEAFGKKERVEAKGDKRIEVPNDIGSHTIVISAQGKDRERRFSKSLDIKVANHCCIQFSAAHEFTIKGVPVTLSWNVEDAETITLDGFGEQQANGQMDVTPQCDTTYTLNVTDAFGQYSQQVCVRVLAVPQIKAINMPTPKIDRVLNIHITMPRASVVATPPILTLRNIPLFSSTRAFLRKLNSGPKLLRPRLYKSKLTHWLAPLFKNYTEE